MLLVTNRKYNTVGHIYSHVERNWFLRWCLSTTYVFVGAIYQLGEDSFIIEKYSKAEKIKQSGFHNSPCRFTLEGDYVRYVESCDLKVEYNKVFTLAQFLSLTNQTKAMFEFNEDIKYSGC